MMHLSNRYKDTYDFFFVPAGVVIVKIAEEVIKFQGDLALELRGLTTFFFTASCLFVFFDVFI